VTAYLNKNLLGGISNKKIYLWRPARTHVAFVGHPSVTVGHASGTAGSQGINANPQSLISHKKNCKMTTTTITSSRKLATLINTFTVKPEKQQQVVDYLIEAGKVMVTIPGFISSNVHRGEEGTRVVNYVQWESMDHFKVMMKDPRATEHMSRCSDTAESYDPKFYEVVSCVQGP